MAHKSIARANPPSAVRVPSTTRIVVPGQVLSPEELQIGSTYRTVHKRESDFELVVITEIKEHTASALGYSLNSRHFVDPTFKYPLSRTLYFTDYNLEPRDDFYWNNDGPRLFPSPTALVQWQPQALRGLESALDILKRRDEETIMDRLRGLGFVE